MLLDFYFSLFYTESVCALRSWGQVRYIRVNVSCCSSRSIPSKHIFFSSLTFCSYSRMNKFGKLFENECWVLLQISALLYDCDRTNHGLQHLVL